MTEKTPEETLRMCYECLHYAVRDAFKHGDRDWTGMLIVPRVQANVLVNLVTSIDDAKNEKSDYCYLKLVGN